MAVSRGRLATNRPHLTATCRRGHNAPAMITREMLRQKRDAILQIAQRHGAHDVRLFGSIARGDNTRDSDVDILVRFEQGRSLFDHGGLIADLEDLLGVQVDVVSEGGMRERFRARVLGEAVPL
jgi:predicted nucleotidyltransferase